MHAIVRTGGKQYNVTEGDVIRVEKLDGEVGTEVVLDDVLMVRGDEEGAEARLGEPVVEGAKIKAEIVDQGRAKKVVVFKFKRRKGYSKKQGHRQSYTALKVKEITGV